MSYRYACILDKETKRYKEFVIIEDDVIQYYDFNEETEEILEKSSTPARKHFTDDISGFIAPKWDGEQWVEDASEEEIQEFYDTHIPMIPEGVFPQDDVDYVSDKDLINILLGVEE